MLRSKLAIETRKIYRKTRFDWYEKGREADEATYTDSPGKTDFVDEPI